MRGLRRCAGLTLMEVLVALTIVGMALALGFQALGQWDRAQMAFAGAERKTREAGLAEAWIREAMRARIMRPSFRHPDGTIIEGDRFVGNRSIAEFTTLSPLQGNRGTPKQQRWELRQAAESWELAQSETTGTVLSLPGNTPPRFVYVDSEGKTHDRWPPSSMARTTAGAPALFGIVIGEILWIEAADLRPESTLNELPTE